MNAVASRNVKFISHSDQGGLGDGVQIMVHRGYAYIGHGYSNGISVLDVRDPKTPRPVAFLPCPPDTRAIHLQTHNDLLLAVNGPSMWTMQVVLADRAPHGLRWGLGEPQLAAETAGACESSVRKWRLCRPETFASYGRRWRKG
jgi:hypothetical protein